MIQPFYVREVKKENGVVEVHLEDLNSLNVPELRENVLWSALLRLYEMGVVPLSFQILSFDIRNTTLYNVARFMASNYEHIRPVYRALKSSFNSRPIVAEVPPDVDDSAVESFVNKLVQLSSTGILSGVHYYPDSRIIRVESMPDSYFMTGGWLEVALADTVAGLCPFREFVLMKNLKFRFKNVINETDVILLSERGNFLFETKTAIHRDELESICYKLIRRGNILGIPPGRIFLVIPSAKDLIGDGSEEPDGRGGDCPGIDVLTLGTLRSVLTRRFYDILVSENAAE